MPRTLSAACCSDPLHAAALVSTGSLVGYLPVYLAWCGGGLARLRPREIAMQATFQGVVVTIAALVLYGRAVAVLGASRGAAFGAVVSALFAIPLLGEWPGRPDWTGIALISAGVYLASGGPLPKAKRERRFPFRLPPDETGCAGSSPARQFPQCETRPGM